MVFHAALVALLFFWAAREGLLGKKLKEIAVIMVPKEKPPEPPKEKPPEPKIEPPKDDTPKPT
ncbi:MAG: putative TonB-dependent receptor, partial [Actinomycetia bacterium]|nr:putative TonB-dependent receptor [Actinomycetes bacterium]